MGAVCGKSHHPESEGAHHHENNNNTNNNQARASPQHILSEELAGHLHIEHAQNINHKFSEFFKILSNNEK